MDSIKTIFKIGKGPSSSHTMGPHKASLNFLDYLNSKNIKASRIKITLMGSLALTGKGHLTDVTIKEVFKDFLTEIIFDYDSQTPFHPNTMLLEAEDEEGKILSKWEVYSIGGGEILIKNLDEAKKSQEKLDAIKQERENIYPYSTMKEILNYLKKTGKNFWEFI
ncbi:MAG TPA: serine dehydratase beta chain, partial [Exilispira sp.]|nr:serine dehydratase beta chain [Exilispira sp.]